MMETTTIELTAGLVPAFVALVVLMAGVVVAAVHRAERPVTGEVAPSTRRGATLWALGLAAWLAATLAAASRGMLRFDSVPPTMVILLVVTIVASVRIARGRAGARVAAAVPLAALVAAQAFRLPLELIMHQLHVDGLMPEQMSYSGLNFDIVTGLLAIPVAVLWAMRRIPLAVVRAWNVLGLLLLLNVLTIAILSAPTPLRVFTNDPVNVWVTQAPWIWLPTLLVPIALVGHIVIFRRLKLEGGAATTTARAAATPAALV